MLVWDGNGRSVLSRETAFWELGLLKRSDWRAKWIGLPEVGEPAPEMAGVKWIWFPEGNPAADAPPGDRFFRGTIEVNGEVRAAEIGFAVDDSFTATLNGRPLASGGGWTSFAQADVKGHLRPGRNELVVKAKNDTSRAGLAVAGRIRYADSRVQHFASGSSWEASKDAREWRAPAVLADLNGLRTARRAGPGPAGLAPSAARAGRAEAGAPREGVRQREGRV